MSTYAEIALKKTNINAYCEKHSIIEEYDYDSEGMAYYFEDGSRVEQCGIGRTYKAYISEINSGDRLLGEINY